MGGAIRHLGSARASATTASLGYELSSLVYGIAEADARERKLEPETRNALAGLEREVEPEVYVTPT